MRIEIIALMALGTLNLALGVLVVFVLVRLSALNKLVGDIERRISRLEILTSLSESRQHVPPRGSREERHE